MKQFLDEKCVCCGVELWEEWSTERYEAWGAPCSQEVWVDGNVSSEIENDPCCVDCEEKVLRAKKEAGDDFHGFENGQIVLCNDNNEISYKDIK